MFSENIKNYRKAKGLSQEELAIKLNVVRQTVSKWEKGLSVPDAEMLIKIADELGVSVSTLLDETISSNDDMELKTLANKLEILNEQLANQKENKRKALRIIFIAAIVLSLLVILVNVLGYIHYLGVMNEMNNNSAIIGGSDAPTNIYVSVVPVNKIPFFASLIALVVSILGLYKIKKR